MMKHAYTVLLFLLAGVVSATAQRCGTGILQFNLYSIEGKKYDLNYEVFEIKEDYLIKIQSNENQDLQYKQKATLVFNIENNTRYFIDDMDGVIEQGSPISRYQRNELLFMLDHKKVAQSGRVRNGVLRFPTSETYHQLFLLKLSDGKRDLFLIGNLFGGCDLEKTILWGEQPRVLLNE